MTWESVNDLGEYRICSPSEAEESGILARRSRCILRIHFFTGVPVGRGEKISQIL
jgi:hypothetical protein